MPTEVMKEWAGRQLRIETGRLAKQAGGSAVVRYADTVVLAAVTASKKETDRDFLPLFVEYREKFYAAGKIPGGFFKREGRPQTKEILSARLVDRPIRPLIPERMRNEIQVIISVLSADGQNDADILAVIGASVALSLSDVPFDGPIAAVRVGMTDGSLVINPTFDQLESSRLNLVVAGTDEAVIMVEGGARELPEEDLVRAIEAGHREIREIIGLQREMLSGFSPQKREVPEETRPEGLDERVRSDYAHRIRQAVGITEKVARQDALDTIRDEASEALGEESADQTAAICEALNAVEKAEVRRMISEQGVRSDGRSPDEVRPITCDVPFLPRTHGSAVFTRGETQALAVVTLGTSSDEQKIDALEGESWKSYMLHYNFPPFSVGEVRRIMGPARREVGHGALAERAIEPVIPSEDAFPYTVRVVSDILESNGSSSMATCCAGSLSLMDAGVPVKAAVAGVAMGLIKEGDRTVVLTDILGAEDHLGDMDFKLAGTREGVTAFQLDSKIGAIPTQLLREAMEKAKTARMHILDIMDAALSAPRPEVSVYAPKIVLLRVPVEKIGEIIGPGGRVIRKLQEQTDTSIDIDDEGVVKISSSSLDGVKRAKTSIELIIKDPEVGEIYEGTVRSITDFGAFIEILPGRDGLCHISELEHHRVGSVEDVLKLGETVKVKVIGVDNDGKVRLSRKALLPGGQPRPQERKDDRRPAPPKRGRPSTASRRRR